MPTVGNWLLVLIASVSLSLSYLTINYPDDNLSIMTKTMMLTMMIITTWMRVGWISARRGFGGGNTGNVEIVIRSGELT